MKMYLKNFVRYFLYFVGQGFSFNYCKKRCTNAIIDNHMEFVKNGKRGKQVFVTTLFHHLQTCKQLALPGINKYINKNICE